MFETIGQMPVVSLTLIAITVVLFAVSCNENLFEVLPSVSRNVLNSMSEGYMLLDAKMNVISFNAAAMRMFPTLSHDSINKSAGNIKSFPREIIELDLTDTDSHNRIMFTVETAKDDDEFEIKTRYCEATVTTAQNRKGAQIGLVIIINDTSEHAELMNRLEYAAGHDALTGVLNRRYFLERYEVEFGRCVRENLPCFLIMADIDFFKSVNDTYGHGAGDTVLAETGRRFFSALRPYDLVGRYGGEEFIMYQSRITFEDAAAFAEKLRLAVADRVFIHDGTVISVTISIGIAALRPSDSPESLIKRADEGLYKSKENGRNRVTYEL
ncbi:hypothetical protein FACS1894120_6680 [Clostridia bacterium]|nr:hypothetical protein FACS1894120_6680 [Clostridia bacterium]